MHFVDILQILGLNFYARVICDNIKHLTLIPPSTLWSAYLYEFPFLKWFREQSQDFRMIALGCLIAVSWGIQTFYQDILINSLISSVLMRRRKRTAGK